jgi:glycerophosphoryl diester phosphodiesterase
MSVQWISHRGESIDAPENTLAAFRLAMARDTDGMECDIHSTADNVLVCCHDETATRTSGQEKSITKSTLAELRQLDFSAGKSAYRGERIPTLAEALAVLRPGKTFYIEIKGGNAALIEPLLTEIATAKVPLQDIVLICFDQEVCRQAKIRCPELRTLWLVSYSDEQPPQSEEVIATLRQCLADGIDLNGNRAFIDAAFVAAVKAAGFYFAVWTIDSAQRARELIAYGVDAITSNRAAALRDEIAGQPCTQGSAKQTTAES